MARRRVLFRSEAREELFEATDYYRERNPTVAIRFELAVERLVNRISDNPEQFAFIDSVVRIAIVTGFPYYLPIVEFGESVEILGVCHASREPGYWKNREQ